MPKKEHAKVAKSARKAGLRKGSKRYKAYVYGTLTEIERRRKAKRKSSPNSKRKKRSTNTRKKARKR